MKHYQLVGIGIAVVDVITHADDSFLDLMGIEKGIMQLVERERGEMLYGAMKERVQAPGGSVANTLAGLGNLGLKTGFIGRVHDDAVHLIDHVGQSPRVRAIDESGARRRRHRQRIDEQRWAAPGVEGLQRGRQGLQALRQEV